MSEQYGKSIIISAPSGAGKTTIVHELINRLPELAFSVSACSRDPRPNEVNGKDYHFLGLDGFKQKIEAGEFIEWEEVYTNNYYGTLKSEVQRVWNNNQAVIFDVDVVGGLNLKQLFGDAALAIFIKAPTFDTLEQRLRYRSTETEEKIQTRLGKAREEMSRAPEFDVVVVNDDLERACAEAEETVRTFLAS